MVVVAVAGSGCTALWRTRWTPLREHWDQPCSWKSFTNCGWSESRLLCVLMFTVYSKKSYSFTFSIYKGSAHPVSLALIRVQKLETCIDSMLQCERPAHKNTTPHLIPFFEWHSYTTTTWIQDLIKQQKMWQVDEICFWHIKHLKKLNLIFHKLVDPNTEGRHHKLIW